MRYIVETKIPSSRISEYIYGNFSEHLGRCIYDGVFVGRDSPVPNVNGMRTDVVEALKEIRLPVLRWPGGCFADEYHWMDGVGPLSSRKRIMNNNWGGVVEDNSFGTHEFLELCRQIGCEPYITGNVGSGTVQEMHDWIEYLNSPGISPMADLRRANGREEPWNVRFFGIGNESWGCGGDMTAEYYADVYRRYQVYLRNYGGPRFFKIACGPGTGISDTGSDWTRTLVSRAGSAMDGISLHYYTMIGREWAHKGSATQFDDDEYARTMTYASFIDRILRDNEGVLDRYDPDGRISLIVDEWGTWFDAEPGTNPHFLYQQNTMRDALVAAITLNIFNKHSRRVYMANIAQLVNVLQSVLLTEGDKLVRTPTFHAFGLFRGHMGSRLLFSGVECPEMEAGGVKAPVVSESASLAQDGSVTVTLANLSSSDPARICGRLDGMAAKSAEAKLLSAPRGAYNDFSAPNAVAPRDAGIALRQDGTGTEWEFELPPCGILSARFRP